MPSSVAFSSALSAARGPVSVGSLINSPKQPLRNNTAQGLSTIAQYTSNIASVSGPAAVTAGAAGLIFLGISQGQGQSEEEQCEAIESAQERNRASTANNEVDEETAEQNRRVQEEQRRNVLRCISRPSAPAVDPESDLEDCLFDAIGPNLDDVDVGDFLCGLASDTQDRIRRQINRTGNLLVDAAESLTSDQVPQSLLDTARKILGDLDPGVVGNCLGAQELIEEVDNKLKKTKDDVRQARNAAVGTDRASGTIVFGDRDNADIFFEAVDNGVEANGVQIYLRSDTSVGATLRVARNGKSFVVYYTTGTTSNEVIQLLNRDREFSDIVRAINLDDSDGSGLVDNGSTRLKGGKSISDEITDESEAAQDLVDFSDVGGACNPSGESGVEAREALG